MRSKGRCSAEPASPEGSRPAACTASPRKGSVPALSSCEAWRALDSDSGLRPTPRGRAAARSAVGTSRLLAISTITVVASRLSRLYAYVCKRRTRRDHLPFGRRGRKETGGPGHDASDGVRLGMIPAHRERYRLSHALRPRTLLQVLRARLHTRDMRCLCRVMSCAAAGLTT